MSKSDVRVNQVFTLLNGSDATRANGCHFFTPLELDTFRNSMLKELVDSFSTCQKIERISFQPKK